VNTVRVAGFRQGQRNVGLLAAAACAVSPLAQVVILIHSAFAEGAGYLPVFVLAALIVNTSSVAIGMVLFRVLYRSQLLMRLTAYAAPIGAYAVTASLWIGSGTRVFEGISYGIGLFVLACILRSIGGRLRASPGALPEAAESRRSPGP
jgi:hypothetical protein